MRKPDLAQPPMDAANRTKGAKPGQAAGTESRMKGMESSQTDGAVKGISATSTKSGRGGLQSVNRRPAFSPGLWARDGRSRYTHVSHPHYERGKLSLPIRVAAFAGAFFLPGHRGGPTPRDRDGAGRRPARRQSARAGPGPADAS